MALIVDKPRVSPFRASERRPWMLRDFLRDDMSSCSSNGFRSFPRRHCCAAVRNIVEREVKVVRHQKPPSVRGLPRSRSFSSALSRASTAFINAVKLIPTVSAAVERKRILPRSFSKKQLKKSWWWIGKGSKGGERKAPAAGALALVKKHKVEEFDDGDDEIERWISTGLVGCEKYQPLDLSNDTTVTNGSTTTSGGKSDSWSDITFISDIGSTGTDTVEGGEELEPPLIKEVSHRKGVTISAGGDSVEPAVTMNSWFNEEGENDQFSPVSVFEFPENGEGSDSPFTPRITHLKGSKERLMRKLGRFESLAGLELKPVNLESLMKTTEMEDISPKFSIESCSTPCYSMSSEQSEEEDEEDENESLVNKVEEKVEHLVKVTRAKYFIKGTCKFEPDNLLMDFFRENIMKEDDVLLKVTEDWLNGHYDELILGWEVKDKRQAYIRDMEEGGKWPKDTILEKEEVAMELGDEVLANLMEELLVEF